MGIRRRRYFKLIILCSIFFLKSSIGFSEKIDITEHSKEIIYVYDSESKIFEKNIENIKSDITHLKAITSSKKKSKDIIINGFLNSSVAILISIINIIIIIWQFNKNQKKEKQLQEKEERIFNLEKKSFWFREIILKENLNKITNYFNVSLDVFETVLSSPQDEAIYYSQRELYRLEKKEMQHLKEILKIIDTTLSRNVSLIIKEHEDTLLNLELDSMTFIAKNNEYERKLINLLYEFEMTNLVINNS
ncbi:hypothetical protein [uncultured Ilyobacter sp.]|uniref:hypothetical protein n=1 Tax=uncultured Ilyobacter sp. TaxID=544433 RepID=UPI0029C0B6A7|nr:hypothetical protein [uncultured Ilyobacter sp.]